MHGNACREVRVVVISQRPDPYLEYLLAPAEIGAGMELATVKANKSPFCRMDSDCWDIVLTFFDEENLMRARKLFRFTIDVSDVIPVTLGKVRSWSTM